MSSPSYRKGDPHLDAFGQQVRELRKRRGMTQERLAHEAGLHRTVVGFIERGEREVGILTAWKIANALGIRVAELFE